MNAILLSFLWVAAWPTPDLPILPLSAPEPPTVLVSVPVQEVAQPPAGQPAAADEPAASPAEPPAAEEPAAPDEKVLGEEPAAPAVEAAVEESADDEADDDVDPAAEEVAAAGEQPAAGESDALAGQAAGGAATDGSAAEDVAALRAEVERLREKLAALARELDATNGRLGLLAAAGPLPQGPRGSLRPEETRTEQSQRSADDVPPLVVLRVRMAEQGPRAVTRIQPDGLRPLTLAGSRAASIVVRNVGFLDYRIPGDVPGFNRTLTWDPRALGRDEDGRPVATATLPLP